MNIYPKECSYTRWLEKKVLKEKIVFKGREANCEEIKKSFTTLEFDLFKDSEGLKIHYNAKIDNFLKRPSISITIPLEKEDYSDYNRIYAKIYVKAKGIKNLYAHFCIDGNDMELMHAPCIKTNCFYECIYEINDCKDYNFSFIKFVPFIGGCPPYSDGDIEITIDEIKFQKVEKEYELGYDIENRIAYSQLGYYNNAKKTFVVNKWDEEFYILKDGIIVKKGKTKKISSSIGDFGVGDFSEITEDGKYCISFLNKKTEEFVINNNPYKEAIDKSIYFLYQLRCGCDIKDVHEPCHLHSFSYNQNGDKVPNFGGWHDAGDLSQFEICTALMTSYVLELYLATKSKKVLEEARVGLNWLLQTSFHDGERALAVLYDKWYGNVKHSDDVHPRNVSENGPFENFLAANALALGSIVFEKIDKDYSNWCLETAKEDYYFGLKGYREGKYSKRWGPSITSQTLGAALTSASLLYKATKDYKYIQDASENAKIVIKCQEKEYIGEERKIRGFFYEDVDHKYLLTYEHRGHESSPICGLVDLATVAPFHEDYSLWIESINLYKEYIEATIDLTSPYDFLVGHIYNEDKVNYDRFTIPPSYGPREECIEKLKIQIKNGYSIGNNWYVRRLPISIQRRGFHATLLSKTKAVSSIAKLLKNDELRQICINQLEWIIGKNPFATSSIYGVGFNYHPLYVAYSNQLIGAMPVGFETLEFTDEVYWPTKCNAVYKEVWGHTTGYFLGVIADLKF